MRWQIEHFVFCDQQQILIQGDSTVALEPMMVELLVFFCHHPDQILTKERLIEEVWLGRIVNDNTISKLVTKLRKVFNDDARQPKYIATFPKKGYKFVATIQTQTLNKTEESLTSVIEQPTPDVSSQSQATAEPVKSQSEDKRQWSFGPFIAMVAAIVTLVWLSFTPSEQSPALYAKAITTDAGDEWFPAFSPDGRYLLHMSKKNGPIKLMLKDLVAGETVEIDHGEDMGVGPGSWSPDGTQIAYLAANADRCQFYRRTFDHFTLGEPQLIHNCPAGSFGKIIFTHKVDTLVFSENQGPGSAYVIYQINVTNNRIEKVNQPARFLGGNSQFDLHPTDNKLLISSPDRQQWEGFYALNLDTNQLTTLFKLDAYICCGIWDHSGERVVLMGEHPAYQLLSYDLSGGDIQAVYSSSRRVGFPLRHPNGEDYLFSSGERNLNIHRFDVESRHQTTLTDASVDERLPAFAYHSHQIAYISLASGTEEVWLTGPEGKRSKKLTQFNDGRHYLDLVWSPSGEKLAALTFNEVHVIDVDTGSYERLKIPQTEIRGISFKSDSQLAYSIEQDHSWRVFIYDLTTGGVEPQDPTWAYVQFHPDSNNILWVNQKKQLFSGATPTAVNQSALSAEKLLAGRRFNLRKRDGDWFWYERDEGNAIKRLSQPTGTISNLVETPVDRFDVRKGQVLFTQGQLRNSNIYQTQSAPHR